MVRRVFPSTPSLTSETSRVKVAIEGSAHEIKFAFRSPHGILAEIVGKLTKFAVTIGTYDPPASGFTPRGS